MFFYAGCRQKVAPETKFNTNFAPSYTIQNVTPLRNCICVGIEWFQFKQRCARLLAGQVKAPAERKSFHIIT